MLFQLIFSLFRLFTDHTQWCKTVWFFGLDLLCLSFTMTFFPPTLILCFRTYLQAGFWPDGPPGVLWMASIKENCFIFHIFPYELFLWADPTTHFRPPIFKSWLTACQEVCLKSKCWQLMLLFLSLSVNYMLIFKAWRCVIQHLQLILMSLHQTRTSWLSCRILQSVSKSTLIHKPCMISLYLL